MDQPAGGIPPEQGALRPAQHFDPLQVVQREIQSRGRQHVELVDIPGDRGFMGVAEIAQADAPDIGGGVGAPALGREVVHVRGLGDHVGAGDEAEVPYLPAVQRGDRNGDVLQALLALLRGDDDFFEDRGGVDWDE